MHSPLSHSPIASPHGAGQLHQPVPDEKAARLVVSLPLAAVCRYAAIEWLMPCMLLICLVAPFVMAFGVWPMLARSWGMWAFPVAFVVLLLVIVGLSAPLAFLIRFFSRRLYVVQISVNGLSKIYGNRDIAFPWRKFYRVIERNGDIWMASFADGCFIPREVFASREEAREFAAIIRSLQQSGGTSWRPQWEGRVFGIHPYGHITAVGE